jgi:hypothetical protein
MKKTFVWVVAFVLFAATPLFPADGGKWFKWSLVSMWLSTSADVTTSLRADGLPGLHETDPLLGKQFGGRGVALEFGSRGVITAVELYLAHRHKSVRPYFSAGNSGLSVASSVAAANNAVLLTKGTRR